MDQDAFGSRSKIATLLLTATIVAAPAVSSATDSRHRPASAINVRGAPIVDSKGQVEVFVRFDEPAVAELNADSVSKTGGLASSDAQKAQAAKVSAQQARMRGAVTDTGAEILSSQRVGANGFRIKVKPDQVENLKQLPGVRSVGRVELHTLDNAQSVPWIGAPAVWAALNKGAGIKIGIIDSGIDYTHADFGGSGNPADYANNDPNIIEPGTFPTAKVKGGYDFAGANYDARVTGSVPTPDPDPIDIYFTNDPDDVGHGTHVAGTAAGIGVSGSVGAGVAPGADLYSIKVFGDIASSTDLTSLGIEWAMDPNGDGDMSDHLDVINMSLGSALGEPADPSAISSNNAAAIGIVVVASAGNEGNHPYVTGAPAVARSAISVAANTPGGRLASRFTVNAPATVAGVYDSLEGAGPVTLAQTGPVGGVLVPTTPADGCAPLTNAAAVNGKIAFVVRGVCGFITKYQTAQAAGAKAIVVYNDGADPTRVAPIVMGGLDNTVTIPGLMISSTAGQQLLAAGLGVTATLDLATNPALSDRIATFSSRGPGLGGSNFKPDLSAPGVSIVSAGAGTGTGPITLQGTSMAAPHVSGAAALLRKAHPQLDPSAIKALLQNSTVDSNPSSDTDLARQGTGAIRVDEAVALKSYAAPGGISFGRLNPLVPITAARTVTLKDLSGGRRSFVGTHVPHKTYPGVEVKCPPQARLVANGQGKFAITLKFDPRVAWTQGVFDDAITSQTEVDGWCVFSDGVDSLRVGYLAVVDPASGVRVLPENGLRGAKVTNIGPALGWAEAFTLAKVGGEQQSGTYGSIAATGFRRGDPGFFNGFGVLEFGIVTEKAFEHLSNLIFRFDIDTNGDGVSDVTLQARDRSDFFDVDPGQFETFQFDAASGDGFEDWLVNSWDYNDRTLILPFTLTTSPLLPGLLPEKFTYTLTVTSRQGQVDVQHGRVDMSKEIVPDLNSFSVEPDDTVHVNFSGPSGASLWLLQNNIPLAQPAFSVFAARKK